MADLYINGSSFASGWGKGYEDIKGITPLDSWTKYFQQHIQPDNTWIDAIPGKSIGMTARDTVKFCKHYKEKYGTLDTLNVVLEFTTPRYRHWDELNTVDGKTAYPVAHLSRTNIRETIHYFIRREFNEHDLAHNDTVVNDEEIVPEELNQWKKQVDAWYFGKQPPGFYMNYAVEEISAAQQYLNDNNVNYVMWWCAGRSKMVSALIERYTRVLYRDAKMIKPSAMSGHAVVENISDEDYSGHPDAKGHKYIADFLIKHINENNLFGRNNNG